MQALSDIFYKMESAFVPNSVVVDLGNTPVGAGVFSISDTSATLDKNVVCSITGVVSTVPQDELEMDPLHVHGYVSAVGTITFLVTTVQLGSLIIGQRTINYFLG